MADFYEDDGSAAEVEAAFQRGHKGITAPPVWRVGRSVGRTVYIQRGGDAAKGDQLIGVMDTPELAARVVDAVNARNRPRVTDRELERLILRAVTDPGQFVQRHHPDFGWPGEPETVPHWEMRAVFAALALADKDIVDYDSTVSRMARLLDQLRRTIDEFEDDPAQALACVREWLDGGREDPDHGTVAVERDELASLENELEEWKARAEAELEEVDPA